MPLLDHFHPPLSQERHWESFHSAWATEIARQLNLELLPERHLAEPNTQEGGRIEIDAATREWDGSSSAPRGGVATATWAPPRAPMTAAVDWTGLDLFEVQVFNDEQGPKLVAAIELISPANKDRPASRQAFVTRCASYLQSNVSVVIVDVITSRFANLHRELLRFLDGRSDTGLSDGDLYAAAYRTTSGPGRPLLEAWPGRLAVGVDLPTLPLWLARDLALPLDLERSYNATWASLRLMT